MIEKARDWFQRAKGLIWIWMRRRVGLVVDV
jgi:hypothetical protein